MTDDGCWFRAWLVVVRRKHAATRSAHAEKREEISGNEMSRRAHGRIRLRIGLTNAEPAGAAANGGQILERIVVIAQVLVGSVREAFPLTRRWCVLERSALAYRVAEQDQLVRIAHRKRFKHHGIDEREDCGVRADTERECQHRDDGKRFSFPQSAESVT